jgi:L-amino acid N-acyltransferase YncA
VRADVQGRGVGTALLSELIRRCEALGYRQLVAVIGDSSHTASMALHASLGFLRVGTLRSAGFKFNRWVDSVIMQRPLGPGDAKPP